MKVNFTSFGLARSDDSFGIRSWDETVLAVLADGAGAARGAREASSRIVESLLSYYEVRPQSWSPPRALLEFTRLINGSLHQESMARYESPEMVSTLAAAVIEGNRLFGLNVGDSRVYLLRQGNFSQLSTDHTVNERGFRHVLKRAMGLADVVEPDAFETELCDGDLLFLCSDGVSNVLGDDSLASKLSHRSAARAIVQHAREHATNDNLDDMSAIVIEIIETGKLKVAAELPLTIPETLKKGDVIDGY
ncbi:MAG: PP2C family serine/threonine-protein phosphatase, partial [Verrucomicrobiota bacterium]